MGFQRTRRNGPHCYIHCGHRLNPPLREQHRRRVPLYAKAGGTKETSTRKVEHQKLSKVTRFLAAAAIILIAGCADMQTLVKTAILGSGDVAAEQEADVVLIHGMGSSSGIGWAADANAKLAAAIECSFDEQAFRSQQPAHPNADKIELYWGELTRPGSPPVLTHSIVWSTVVTPWKQTLCYDTSEKIDGVCDSPAAFAVLLPTASTNIGYALPLRQVPSVFGLA